MNKIFLHLIKLMSSRTIQMEIIQYNKKIQKKEKYGIENYILQMEKEYIMNENYKTQNLMSGFVIFSAMLFTYSINHSRKTIYC